MARRMPLSSLRSFEPVLWPGAQSLRGGEKSARGPPASLQVLRICGRCGLAGSLQKPRRMVGESPQRAHKVLLVDGDFRTGQRLAELLRQDGFEVDVVRDGAEAVLRLALDEVPDTVITELRLPVGDGPTVGRYARARGSAVRVIVLTRFANMVTPATFGEPPPIVLEKPLDYERLLDVMGKRQIAAAELPASGSLE